MFTFIKKLFGLDKATMKDAGVQIEQAPYKVEVIPTTHSDVLVITEAVAPPPAEPAVAVVEAAPAVAVVEAAPAKKPRKPRTPKAVVETTAVKKAAPVKKAAAMKAAPKAKTPRSKKI